MTPRRKDPNERLASIRNGSIPGATVNMLIWVNEDDPRDSGRTLSPGQIEGRGAGPVPQGVRRGGIGRKARVQEPGRSFRRPRLDAGIRPVTPPAPGYAPHREENP